MICRRPWLLLCLSLVGLAAACEFRPTLEPLPTPIFPVVVPATTTSIVAAVTTATPRPPPILEPTPAPQATATYDPGLADWTILVYLAADNNLELSGLLDVNEMEAAGDSDRVHVLVQMDRAAGETDVDGDWTEARRYLVRGDQDLGQITSEPVAVLGEVNMGDPAVLADFLSWGMQTYPANRYALILWDHGAGWNGMAYDNDTANYGLADNISLPDLQGALERALAQSNVDRLDVIGFDACLMGQLDVFQAVQPYARYAVGSEELTPGQGWDYQALLGHLYATPALDGAQLARQMVSDFAAYYRQIAPHDFVTMAAVDLARLPGLTQAVEVLATALTADPSFVVSAIGDARSGAESFARVYASEFDHYAAVDLHHFAAILAQRSPDERVSAAAQQVMQAIETTLIASERGPGFKHSRGIAVYFPRNAQFYGPGYADVTAMKAWPGFLANYYTAGLTELPPPAMHLNNVLGNVTGIQQPAYLDIEIVGRNIENVVLMGGRYEADGRRRLLEFDTLIPEPTTLPDGSKLVEWRDGVHDDFFIWRPEVTYLYDSAGNGDFVVMWPALYTGENSPVENGANEVGLDAIGSNGAGHSLFTVQGRYRRAAGQAYFDANLVFDQGSGQLRQVWSRQASDNQALAGAPAEILPRPGDEFQPYSLFLDANGTVVREPQGPGLFFADDRQLYFDWRPLPDGNYFLGFAAENVAGDRAEAFTDLTIDNSQALPGYEAYLDPYLGFHFLYPATWYTPVYSGTLLYTSNLSGTTQVQITIYPNLEPAVDPAALKTQTLNHFGPVDVLFEDAIAIAGAQGWRTAYGYTRANGEPRTGVFFTFIQDGTGFVVDVDGPQADEAATVAAVAAMVDSWRFAPAGFGLQPGRWARLDLDAFSVAQPADFAYQQFNEWQRFIADQYTFVALRTQPATRPVEEVLAALIRDASEGMADFVAGDAHRFPLGGTVWQRVNFRYTAADGIETWGFIMVKLEEGQEIVAWAEAPSTTYNELEPGVFLVMVADLSLRP